jgi:hypothetical protein
LFMLSLVSCVVFSTSLFMLSLVSCVVFSTSLFVPLFSLVLSFFELRLLIIILVSS